MATLRFGEIDVTIAKGNAYDDFLSDSGGNFGLSKTPTCVDFRYFPLWMSSTPQRPRTTDKRVSQVTASAVASEKTQRAQTVMLSIFETFKTASQTR